MPKPVRYHLGDQYAAALLHPLQATLRDLEDRAHHYAEHLPMAEGDLETIRQTAKVLTSARAEIERLRRESSGIA